jgi:hypothetical protein
MRTLSLFLLLTACEDARRPLGGQEGEPVAPGDDVRYDAESPESPPAPAPAPPDTDAAIGCEVVAHCQGDDWCATYSAETLPDLEATCPDHWGEGPCPADALATCPLGEDLCTVVWLYSEDAGICGPG